MPLSCQEIKENALKFAKEWEGEQRERAESIRTIPKSGGRKPADVIKSRHSTASENFTPRHEGHKEKI